MWVTWQLCEESGETIATLPLLRTPAHATFRLQTGFANRRMRAGPLLRGFEGDIERVEVRFDAIGGLNPAPEFLYA